MTEDRNYLRMLSDSELVNMGRERDSGDDLVLVLAERLAELLDVEDQLEDAKREIVELEHRVDSWMGEANALQAQLEAQ
jgi:hypothetical protein